MEKALEIWRAIAGYEGLYEVSSWGRVRSLNYCRRGKIVILNLSAKPNKYIKVGLRKNGKTTTFWVHRLVAVAFLLPPQKEQTQVDHIDGDKQNNQAECE